MAKKIGFAIVGYGAIGPAHARGITGAPGAELRAVCDADPEREKALREQGYDVPFYTDHKEMLKREPGVEAVCICTPSGLHSKAGIDAARAGRHVLSEKPIDITLPNIDRLIDACDKAKVKLGCIFQLRTYPINLVIKKALEKNLLGPLFMLNSQQKYYRSPAYYKMAGWRGTWKMDGGGALMNQAIHGIDLMLWLAESEVESVFSYSDHLVRDIEVEDTSLSVIRFKNGTLGSIIGTTSVVPGEKAQISVHGANGSIYGTNEELKCTIGKLVKGSHVNTEVDLPKRLRMKLDAKRLIGHAAQVQDMCNAIRKDTEPMVSGPEARRSVELILAIYKSWKTRKEVTLPLK